MSHDMHHFSMGIWVLFLAYAVSVIGSLAGLICARQATEASHRTRQLLWSGCAALAIGGVAIWLMHFIGMMGFDVPGTVVRYGLARTLLSVVLAVAATAVGLAIVARNSGGSGRTVRLLVAGVVMGLAVSAMHYAGMWALRIQGSIEHDWKYVIASVVIGLVAATAALWFTQVAGQWRTQVPAALVMGLGVVALHYTGMAGVHVHVDPTVARPVGLSVTELLFTGFLLGSLVLVVIITALLFTRSEGDRQLDEQIGIWHETDTASR